MIADAFRRWKHARRIARAEAEAKAAEQTGEDLTKELEHASARLEALTPPESQTGALVIAVQGAGTPADIRITSLTRQASWQPVYDLSLQRKDSRLRMERGLMVTQSTGEDWQDVRLTLSTAPGRHSTRMGAALRHATAHLAHEASDLKAILLLTDGAPSDIDVHEPRYLVEDARHAVLAARAAGAAWLAPAMGALLPPRIAVAPGAQTGLNALLSLLTLPGDTVLLEPLTSPGLTGPHRQRGPATHGGGAVPSPPRGPCHAAARWR